MTTLRSMIGNLTRPYRQGAYLQELELAHLTEDGSTEIHLYDFEDYATRFGVSPWDIKPVYLVAPLFDLDHEYICLNFDVLGWAEDQPKIEVRIPAYTPAGTTFIIPLNDYANGLTKMEALHEWPEPSDEATPGRQRWQILALVGDLGRLLWVIGWEKAHLNALAQEVGSQRYLASAHGYSLDMIGQELKVPRLMASPYPVDPATIALYHLNRLPGDVYDLTSVGNRVIDETGRYHGQNEGAERGLIGRIDRAFGFHSGDLPRPQCSREYEFQQKLRSGDWDAEAGERAARFGPYRRFGYREGAITITRPDGEPHAVWVNDEAEDEIVRGQLTSACHGIVPRELDDTIDHFVERGRSIKAAIDYFGQWWGRPEDWFTAAYEHHDIEAAYQSCEFMEQPLTYVRIPNRSAFDIPADQSFTVEAFILPRPTDDNRLRLIAIKSHEVFYGGPSNVHCVEGWALSMGTFNCIPNNVAWSLSDLPDYDEAEREHHLITITADLNLGDEQWHHVAGVIDRRYQVARLYVDGIERGCQYIGHIGEISNQEDILLAINDYHFDAPYDGLIDEVRISDVARRSFHPALGESDDRYRTRLSIYRPWLIPTCDNMRAGMQRLFQQSPFGPEVPAPELPEIDLIVQDSVRLCTEKLFKIRPLSLPPGAHIDLEGNRQIAEEEACGPRDEHFFDWQLLTHDDPMVQYVTANARRMQLATARSLDNLIRLLTPWINNTGNSLHVLQAYEPGSDNLAAVGRALHLWLDGLPGGVLAAFAHKACFDYVENLGNHVVRASVREEIDKLEIATQDEVGAPDWPGRADLIRMNAGDDPLPLAVARPVAPDERYYNWLLVECGSARGRLQPVDGSNASRLFVPTAPGSIFVKVEYVWQGSIVAGQREIRIGLNTLPPCESIGDDGTLGVSESQAAGEVDDFFHEALLIEQDDPRADDGGNLDVRRMQLGMGKSLNQLLDLIDAEPDVSGSLRILSGYDPAASDLARVGRKLMLVHEDEADMPLGRLAALAHDAGFAWVYHPPYPEGIYVAAKSEVMEIIPGPIEYLAANAVINWLGIMRGNVPEAPIEPGTPFDAFDPANIHDDPARVNYVVPGSAYMTPATGKILDKLLDRLDGEEGAGKLNILGAFDDTAVNRRQIGAALEMRHESIPLSRLGALAHQAGFDYVKYITVPADHYIYASVWRGEDFSWLIHSDIAEIVDCGLFDPDDYAEVAEEGVRRLCLHPDILDWTPPPIVEDASGGHAGPSATIDDEAPYRDLLPDDAHYYWCLTRYGPGQGRLDSPPVPNCKLFTAQLAAVVGARGEFVWGDATEPYRFEVLAETAEQGSASIPKLVYDDLMNFLDFRHPVGVEACTLSLRPHVVELMKGGPLYEAGTDQTYPDYRLPRATISPARSGDQEMQKVACACPPWQDGNLEEVN